MCVWGGGAFRRWRSSQCFCCSAGNYTRGTEIGRCLLNSYQIKLRRKRWLTVRCSNPTIQPPSPPSPFPSSFPPTPRSSSTAQFLLIHLFCHISSLSLIFFFYFLSPSLSLSLSAHWKSGCPLSYFFITDFPFILFFFFSLSLSFRFFIGFSGCFTLPKAGVCVLFSRV